MAHWQCLFKARLFITFEKYCLNRTFLKLYVNTWKSMVMNGVQHFNQTLSFAQRILVGMSDFNLEQPFKVRSR